jgi:hypothetical protein
MAMTALTEGHNLIGPRLDEPNDSATVNRNYDPPFMHIDASNCAGLVLM